jgi:hypothetical protein
MENTFEEVENKSTSLQHKAAKLAEHSRKYYLKKITEDPNFNAKLAERTRLRRLRLRMEAEGTIDIIPRPKGRPKKEIKEIEEKEKPPRNPPGRPRKY